MCHYLLVFEHTGVLALDTDHNSTIQWLPYVPTLCETLWSKALLLILSQNYLNLRIADIAPPPLCEPPGLSSMCNAGARRK